jgi:hypothetical protein
MFTAAVTALVDHDKLCAIGEWFEGWLEHRMVEARPSMQQEYSWPLMHPCSIWAELLAYNIEEQAYAVDHYMHCSSSV